MIFRELLDAYAEIVTAIMYIRVPGIIKLADRYPTIGIKSSYSDEKKDTIINTKSVLDAIIREGNKSPKNLRNVMTQVARIFILSVWDMLKNMEEYPRLERDEIVQFTRHIRNGVAHNNKFDINSTVIDKSTGFLKLLARWRDKVIEARLDNSVVIPDFLKDGDVYYLIHDLEEHINGKK